jgi:hypothetical protein
LIGLAVAVASPFVVRGPLLRSDPVKVESLELLRGRAHERAVPLTAVPGPVVKDDAVAVVCRLSRPAYPYLFWVHSKGDVVRLHPRTAREARRRDRFRWPTDEAKLGKIIEGEPGTELAILVVRDEPWTEEELAQLMGRLRSPRPLGALVPGTVLVDESPIERNRGADDLEEMLEAPIISYLQDVRTALETQMGTVRTIALTHVEKR